MGLGVSNESAGRELDPLGSISSSLGGGEGELGKSSLGAESVKGESPVSSKSSLASYWIRLPRLREVK